VGSGIESCAHKHFSNLTTILSGPNLHGSKTSDLITNSTSTSFILNHLTPPVTRRRTTLASTVSAASHTSERKHTLERAKANHVSELLIIYVILICNYLEQLSRQLQMRLQYARLKVEHGWVYLFSCTNFRVYQFFAAKAWMK